MTLARRLNVLRSPFRFVGSKYQAVKLVKPIWEVVRHDEYREPLVGGGAIFFAKPKARINWLNDLDDELITTYSVMRDVEARTMLMECVSKEIPTKARHWEMRNANYSKDDPLAVAHRYFFLNRTSYSGMMNVPPYGYSETKSVPPGRWGGRIDEAGKKLEDVKLTSLDFEDVICAPKLGDVGVFMFVDPPYFLADQKRAYIHSFELEDHLRLHDALKRTKHKFCLTYDDCKEVRGMYDWACIRSAKWRYHVANSNKAARKMGNELIITNFEPDYPW